MNRKILLAMLFLGSCAAPDADPLDDPLSVQQTPSWAQEAIWYQIFVERFRNGDPSNDPRLSDMAGSWPQASPAGWRPTAWGHDWYEQEDWARALGRDFYYTVQLRRYGGDLQGVLDRLDYLEDLGVTALYLNPINDAPSLHKYDARNYRHVDRNFGPDPDGDLKIMEQEDPADPSTWRWTSADSLFLELVAEVHRRGMRIIVDYSWNHTGVTFWAWRDILEKQAASRYASWYSIDRFDDPSTPENEFAYRGWAGVRELPEWKKVGVPGGTVKGPVEGDLQADVKRLAFAVTRRWLDPNGDGDPRDGIDGFRLDVAEMVPLGFWRDYRRVVRSVNPDAYLVGEVWWERWPETMMDPRPYLGDAFDAVMNYRWYRPTRSFFGHTEQRETATSYMAHLDSIESGIAIDNLRAMMNLTASHDSPRFSTSLYNPGRYKAGVNPRDNPAYRLERPDGRTREIQKLILVHQFTYHGAPHVWYGDEVGMWGADDPDNRKPMVWADLAYDAEQSDPLGRPRRADAVAPDTTLLAFYRQLIALRKAHPDLFVEGRIHVVVADDDRSLLAYSRATATGEALVVFNASGDAQQVTIPIRQPAAFSLALRTKGGGAHPVEDGLEVALDPREALILIRS